MDVGYRFINPYDSHQFILLLLIFSVQHVIEKHMLSLLEPTWLQE